MDSYEQVQGDQLREQGREEGGGEYGEKGDFDFWWVVGVGKRKETRFWVGNVATQWEGKAGNQESEFGQMLRPPLHPLD